MAKDSEEKCKLVSLNILSLAFSIAMVVIGVQYNDEKYCKIQAPLFLLIGGGISLGMTILKLIAIITPCEYDDKLVNCLTPFSNLANFCILIWGSVVVFGAYQTWDYKDPSRGNYCAYTPYMFTFVILILDWVLAPLIMCIEFCILCGIGICSR